jgi:hypothetical protein
VYEASPDIRGAQRSRFEPHTRRPPNNSDHQRTNQELKVTDANATRIVSQRIQANDASLVLQSPPKASRRLHTLTSHYLPSVNDVLVLVAEWLI